MAKKSRGGRMTAAKTRAAKRPGGKGMVKNRPAGRRIMSTWEHWCGSAPANSGSKKSERKLIMLYTIAVIVLVLWLLGLVTSYTMGGFIHILLVIAIVMVLVNVISGRRRVL
jgi:Family of unknown function (DUF5670)